MIVFKKEHIELLRQYFSSDDPSIKNEMLESIPVELREKVALIQDEFDKNSDAKFIASKVNAQEFEKELEEIQSAYYLNKLGLPNQEFNKELIAAITPIEREALKKKLIAFEEMSEEELSNVELKSAITLVERESLKKKLQNLDDSSKGKIIAINSILKYAVAACFVIAVGIGIYQFTREESISENIVASSSEKEQIDQNPTDLTVIETAPLEEISITSNSYPILKPGLGYGEVEEKVTVVVNNQKERILSVQKAISTYKKQIENLTDAKNPGTDQIVTELRNRISALQDELTQFTIQENQYVFDGKVLTLFVSSALNENPLILYDSNYYLNKNNRFYKLTISKEPQPLLEETDPDILKALDKIIFNAD